MNSRSEIVAALAAAGCVRAGAEARLLVAEASDDRQLARLVARRVAGEPLEHVLGWAQFAGRRHRVAPGVFVPRHRSLALVAVAARCAVPGAVVVDLCCGCGALGRARPTGCQGSASTPPTSTPSPCAARERISRTSRAGSTAETCGTPCPPGCGGGSTSS